MKGLCVGAEFVECLIPNRFTRPVMGLRSRRSVFNASLIEAVQLARGQYTVAMIAGAYFLLFSKDVEADRAFFERRALGLKLRNAWIRA